MRQFNKIFGIGRSRTGTSSLDKALNLLGIKSFHVASKLTEYIKINKELGYSLLHGLERFRGYSDHPIDWLYKELDKMYPGSLFIYTRRDDREAWVRSMWSLPYHLEKGEEIWHKEGEESKWVESYETHEKEVREYFKDRDNYLELDITKDPNWEPICEFLEIYAPKKKFPHMAQSQVSAEVAKKVVKEVSLAN